MFTINCNRILGKRILAASGASKASLVLKHARVVNVSTETLEEADVTIGGGSIMNVGSYDGAEEVDLGGMILCSRLMDGHIHLESSMVSPGDFYRAVLPHRTTAVTTDPHEVANVAGMVGIQYMMEATENLDLDVFFMLLSCVPSAGLDESEAVLDAAVLEPFYKGKRVLGLAELMNSYGTMKVDAGILEKVGVVLASRKLVDGHAPFPGGTRLNAYVTAGVILDHECLDTRKVREKYVREQWTMVREGTVAGSLEALTPLSGAPYYQRNMLTTDDKHSGGLVRYGHIDYIIRSVVKRGADPVQAIKMDSLSAASYFGIKNRGMVAPGYLADLVLLKDSESFEVFRVWKAGKAVAESRICLAEPTEKKNQDNSIEDRVSHSFHTEEIKEECLVIPELADGGAGKALQVIGLTPDQSITAEMLVPYALDVSGEIQPVKTGYLVPGMDIGKDIVKLAVFKHHHHIGRVGLGSLGGYGLKKETVASGIAHGSHSLTTTGINDADMVLAGNCVRKNWGDLVVAVDGKLIEELPLPIDDSMTGAPAGGVEKTLEYLKGELRKLGVPETVDPSMTLGFVSLLVIPKLRLNIYGVVDVDSQSVAPAVS